MSEPTPRPRPQVSLLSLFLITALAATSLSTFLLWREVGPLRRDVRRLREELGEVSVTDASRPHAVQVETDHRRHWKWRVWVPEGRWYEVLCVHDGVPAQGLPAAGKTLGRIGPGEHVIDYRLEPDEDDGVWVTSATTARGVSLSRVTWGDARWLQSRGVTRETQNSAPDEPFVLWRHRAADEANPKNLPGPTDGFMIWLRPR